jgi:hypothetical protein
MSISAGFEADGESKPMSNQRDMQRMHVSGPRSPPFPLGGETRRATPKLA